MTLTATIAGRSASLYRDSLGIADKINEQSDVTITVIDLTGTARYAKNMPVTITDSIKGDIWSGYINNKPTAQVLYPNPGRTWSLDCRDQTWLMSKRSSNRTYTNQFAGVILVDQIQRYGSEEGLTAAAALGWYELFTEWQNATLTGTLATTNASSGNPGDGDLELALAGSTVTFQQSSQSDFNLGPSGGMTATASGVTFTPSPAIKLQATQNIPGLAKPYTFVKIWDKSIATYTIPSSFPALYYDVWIASDSPKQTAAIEVVCTDGSSYQADPEAWDADTLGINGGIATDLSGLATNQWYSRKLPLFGDGSLGGKALQYVAVAFGGTDQGTYTAYFRNIKIAEFDGTTNKLDVFSSSATAIPITPQQLQDSGYVNMSCSFVTAYERHGFMLSPAFSLSAAGIARSSYVSWDIVLPDSMSFSITASVDGFSTFLPCTINAAIPDLLPGMSLTGKNLNFVYVFDSTGSDPTLTPVLSRVAGAVMPAYVATKSDSITTTKTQAQWNAGTLTNLVAPGGNVLQLSGFARDWSNADTSGQTLFGTAGVDSGMSSRQFFVSTTGAGQANSRLDFVGNWQDFTAEVDVRVETNGKPGIQYRTTNWSNADANYAYAVEITLAGIFLQRGSNSASGTTGTRTQLGTAAFVLNSGDTHRLKVVVAGSSHQIFLDDVRYLNITDSTYSAAGGISLRSAPAAAYTQIFDNFGVVASLVGTWVSPAIDLHALGTISNSQLILQIDPAANTTITTFVPEISLNNGSTWTTCNNSLTGNTTALSFVGSGYYQVLPVPGLAPGTNVSGLTQVKIRITIAATTAATGASMPALQAMTLFVLGAYSSSGTWSTAPLAWDSAQRSNVVGGFGTATNGASYTKSGTGTTNLVSNMLQISATTGDVHMRIGSLAAGDQEATVRVSLDSSSDVAGVELRYVNANNFYRLAITTTAISLVKAAAGIQVTLESTAKTLAIATVYQLRFRVIGSSSLYGRVWPDGTMEPMTWDITASD